MQLVHVHTDSAFRQLFLSYSRLYLHVRYVMHILPPPHIHASLVHQAQNLTGLVYIVYYILLLHILFSSFRHSFFYEGHSIVVCVWFGAALFLLDSAVE